jgi:ABC-type antimicrobial peptide transport system permease subunit
VLLTGFRLAVRGLGRNKLRTVLTMLGMIIGVAAVLAMIALGNGAEANVEQDMRSAGTSLVHVNAGNYTRGGEESRIATGLGAATTLVPADADAIAREVAGVKALAAGVRLRGWVASGARRFYGQVLGTDVAFPSMYGWRLDEGSFFTAKDVTARRRVAVLGRTARDQTLTPGAKAVGQHVTIHGRTFDVIGVSDTTDPDQSEMVFVPYTALQDALGIDFLHTITVHAREAGEATRVAADITTLLRARHAGHINAAMEKLRHAGITGNQMPSSGLGGVPDDFTVKTQASEALTRGLYTSVAAFVLANMPKLDAVNLEEMNATLARATVTMTALLAGIAAISLVVGGVGIMNIMLVAVKERTREIGVRRAVGARKRDVLVQFLVEALTLSAVGGAIGIVLGLIACAAMTAILEWPTRVSLQGVALAFGISAAIGIFFGFHPARRAAQLDPINALRTE